MPALPQTERYFCTSGGSRDSESAVTDRGKDGSVFSPHQHGGIDGADGDAGDDRGGEVGPGFVEGFEDPVFVGAQSSSALEHNGSPITVGMFHTQLLRSM